MSARTDAKDLRRRQLAAIHMRAKQLGLDRETYEQMLWTVARVNSARDLDEAGRRRVLDHMRSLGHGRRLHNVESRDRGPLLRKIRAMLDQRSRKVQYADGMAKHMFGVTRVEWCTPDQLRRIVAALTYDEQRRRQRDAAS